MKTLKYLIILSVICSTLNGFALDIDGKLNEPHWQYAIEFNQFKTYQPSIGFSASENTRVLVANDSVNLYVAVIAYDNNPSKIMANLTNRDNLNNDDAFTVEIDVNGSSNSNIFFRVNPLGIQEDGVIAQNESEDLNPDRVWYSKGFITDFGYQVEMAIPFQTLRFKWKPNVEMKMGFVRKINHKSEVVVYPEFNSELSNRLMQRESVTFSNIKKQRVLEVIPAITYTYDNVKENGNWNVEQNNIDAGVTGKIGLTSDLVLDLTYNPDFSQIESDAGAIDINLRNPLFFPEKRPFFQEGIELFDCGGSGIYHLPLESIVHTRNIVDPIYGLKLTGNLGEKYSVASIVSTDESTGNNDHYQIARLQHKLKDDSFIGVTYTGKETDYGYNRVGGFDGKLRINGKNSIEYNFFRSFSEDSISLEAGNNFGAHYNYKDKFNKITIGYYQNDKNFDTETGFLTRKGIHAFPAIYYFNMPLKYEKINKLGLWLSSRPKIDMSCDKFEYSTYAGFELFFKHDSWIWMGKSTASEIFQNQSFKTGYYATGYTFQFNKYLNLDGYVSWNNKIYYDEMNPFQGHGWTTKQSILFTPTKQLKIDLTGRYTNFYKSSNDELVYDYSLARLHTTYQLNKNLFLRAIGEYNFYKNKLSSELLLSFTYIPGTVLQIGYNLNAGRYLPDENRVANNELMINKSLLFFKASYLFKK